MVNDTTTLNGALTELGETMATNISAKGVTASASDGLTTLASKISQIQTGGGGATNIVQGTFTTGSTRDTVETISLSYTGNGYPIASMVFVNGGTDGNTTWYNLLAQHDVGAWLMLKQDTTSTPTYISGSENYGYGYILYKNSSTTATSITGTSGMNMSYYRNSPNALYGTTCVVFNSATQMKVSIGNSTSSTRGLTPSTTYVYIVIYSE